MNFKNRKGLREAINDAVGQGWVWGYFAGILIGQIIDLETTANIFGSLMIYFLVIVGVQMCYKSKYTK